MMIEPYIDAAAKKWELPSLIVNALVSIESAGNPWAWNPEPSYHYLWNVRTRQPYRHILAVEALAARPPADFPCLGGDPDQEWWGQKASWGLMQVMGAVARERGFMGIFLTQLCDPTTNLDLGCQHLSLLLHWAHGDLQLTFGAYNAGRANATGEVGQRYAGRVLARYQALVGDSQRSARL